MKTWRLLVMLFFFLLNPEQGLASDNKFIGSIAISGKDKHRYADLAKISFQNVLSIVEKNHPGKIIEVALENEKGFLVYEIELISPENNKKEVIIDAGTGAILFVKEKKIKSRPK